MANVGEYIGQSRTFLNEVVVELRRVAWPPRKETLAFTWVVLILVAFIAVYLGVIDWVLSLLLGLVF